MKLFGREIEFDFIKSSVMKKENWKFYGLIFVVALVVYLLMFAPEMDTASVMKKVRFASNPITQVITS